MFLGLETGRNFESFRLFCHRLSIINIYLGIGEVGIGFSRIFFCVIRAYRNFKFLSSLF